MSIDNNGVLTASGTVPFSNNYEITVQAAVTGHKQSNTTDTVTCKVTIDPVQITFDSQYAIVVSRDSDDTNHSTNPTRVRIEVKGLNMEKNSLRVQQNPFVRGLEQEVTASGENAVLSLNMTQEKPQTGSANLRVSLKDDSSVYNNLQVYFLRYNQFYGGKYVYIPVPGDVLNFIADKDNNGIPDTTSEATIEDEKYGYAYVTVNEVVYQYYVDTNNVIPDVEWFVRIGNGMDKYIYNRKTEMYDKQ